MTRSTHPGPVLSTTAAGRRSLRPAALLLTLAGAFVLAPAQAQIQRGFDNLGFEVPDLGTNACFVITRASDVPGWNTTETNTSAGGSGCNGYTSQAGSPGNGGIEIWANTFNGVTSAEGTQHAELNAFNSARLSQSVCLISGELIGFTMAHRGRGSATVADVAEFNIDSAANTVLQASTTSNGTGGIIQCGGLTLGSPSNGPVAGTTDGVVTTPTCSSATLANGWRSYTGSFTWSGTTDTHNIGFAALSAAGGIAAGNFLDAVNVTLQPVIEFAGPPLFTGEGPSATPASIIVVGNIPAGGTVVNFTVTAGTATQGTDYTTTGTFTVPAGSYPTPTTVPIGAALSVIDDAVVEENETVQLTIQPNPSAYVLGSTTTCGGPPNTSATYTIIDNDIDLLTTKSASTATPLGGVPFQYTVTFLNNTAATTVTPLTAHDAVAAVADAVPAGLTFTSWTCTASNGASCPGGTVNGTTSGSGAISGNATLPAGNAAAGGLVTYVIDAVAPAASCSGSLVNTSQITTPAGLEEGTSAQAGFTTPAPGGTPNNTASTTGSLGCASSVSLSKTDGSATYTPGGSATYTVVISNAAGPSVANNVGLNDPLPAGVTLSGAPSCSAAGTATCGSMSGAAGGSSAGMSGGSIAAGAGNTLTILIPVNFAASLTTSPLVNTATATATGSTDATASDSDTRAALVNLSLVKTATPAGTYLPGSALNYSLVLTNNGPSAASGITLSDTVPASVTVSGWTCSASGAGADCDTGSAGTGASGSGNAIALNAIALGAGESVTVSISGTAQLSATGAIVNTASASPPAGASCTTPPCTVTSTATNTDAGAPQLALSKMATPSAFAVGQNGTYTLQLSNSGSSSTTGALSINDPLPAGITSTGTPTGSGWNCAASTATVISCSSNAVLPPGASAPPVTVNVTVAVGTSSPAVNTASASGGGDSSCPSAAHCQATTTTPVDSARLELVKTLQGNLVVGVQSLYIISVTNTGQATALAGTISDTIPTGLTIGTLPAGCSAAGQVVTCTLAAGLATGNSVSYTIPITPQASVNGQSLSNSASVSGGGDASCPAAPHCTGTTTDTVSAPQLSIVKSATPASFVIGVAATYTLQVTNIGTATTTATSTISDSIPTGLTIGTLPAGCSAAGQVVTCTIAAGLATNTPVSFAIPVTPQASLAGLSVTNTATATGGGDPSCPAPAPNLPARCSDSVTTPIGAPVLEISKTASGANFVVGVPASYTLTVLNTGSAATTAVATVSDTIPGDLSIGALPAGCSAAGQVVTCTIAAGLAPGSPVSFVIPVTPTAAASGQVQINSASVSGGGDPTCPGAEHCGSSTSTPVNAPLLEIVKSASAAAFVVGVPASYTLTVTNTGSAATTAVTTVSDTIPSGLTLGALPPGCSAASQVVTCTIAAGLASGAPVSFVIPVTPTAAASGTSVVNRASVSGGGDPTCPGEPRCESSTSTPVDAPQLSVSKTASAAAFVVGVPASYTLTVTNTGTAATTAAASVSDTIPAVLTLGTLPAGCSAAGQVVTCTVAAGLASGAPVSFVIPVTPTAAASGSSVVNSATVSGGGDPSCPGQAHCGSTTTTPVDAPQLSLVKQASASAFVVGVAASYTLTVTNTGTAATTAAATVSDTLPAALTLGALPAGCTASGQSVSCTIAAGLGAGASVAFVIPVTPTPAASGQTLVNSATVSGGGAPNCPGAANCTSTVSTPVDAPALRVVKTASAAGFVVGVPASYTLTVTNIGSAATTAVTTVSDTVPATLTLGTLPAGCSAAGQVVTCTIAAGLASGTPVSFLIPVTPTAAANGSVLTNTAIVSGGGDPACPGGASCTSTVNTPVNAPQLRVLKTASAPNFVVGVAASYTLTVTNSGSVATTAAATVNDTVAASLTLGAMPAGCTVSGQQVTCSIPAGLAAGASVAFVIPVTPNAAAAGSSVTNAATVSGGGDPTCPAAASCTSTTSTPVQAPQLSLVKTASSAGFEVGVPASYTLTVTNIGNAATTVTATVTDAIPAVLSLGALPAGCTASGQVVSCNVPAGLATGANVAFVIPVTPLPAAAGTSLSNTATVSGGGGSCVAGNCSSSVDTPIGDNADLGVLKQGPASIGAGGLIGYTITVANAGPSSAIGVIVTDPTPPGLSLVSASAPCAAGFPCNVGDLAAGGFVNLTVTYAIPPGYTNPNPLINTASASSSTPDPNPANNSSSVSTSVAVAPPARPVPLLDPAGRMLLLMLLVLTALAGLAARQTRES